MKDSDCLARSALRADVHLACVAGPDVGVVVAPGTVGRAGDVPLTCASVAREHLHLSTRDGRAVLRVSPGVSPRARALASAPVAPISGGSAAPCGYPNPSGGGCLRAAGPASALGLARSFRTRPGISDGFVSPAGSSPGLRARHGRVSSVEAALKLLTTLRARAGLRGRCTGRGRRIDCLGVAGTPAPPGLGRRGAGPDPCGASGLVLSPAGYAGCRVAGAAHARGATRAPVGIR